MDRTFWTSTFSIDITFVVNTGIIIDGEETNPEYHPSFVSGLSETKCPNPNEWPISCKITLNIWSICKSWVAISIDWVIVLKSPIVRPSIPLSSCSTVSWKDKIIVQSVIGSEDEIILEVIFQFDGLSIPEDCNALSHSCIPFSAMLTYFILSVVEIFTGSTIQ